jgi:hypothetical protein
MMITAFSSQHGCDSIAEIGLLSSHLLIRDVRIVTGKEGALGGCYVTSCKHERKHPLQDTEVPDTRSYVPQARNSHLCGKQFTEQAVLHTIFAGLPIAVNNRRSTKGRFGAHDNDVSI